jgi:UDP-N-acetylmuramate--alanine ligase
LDPFTACILKIEEDHLDYFRDMTEIEEAFSQFAARIRPEGLLVVNGKSRHALRAAASAACRVETFGFEASVDWQAEILSEHQGCAAFRVRRNGRVMTDVQLRIPGRHNVSNALATTAMCLRAGVDPEVIAEALGEFRGAERRLTWHGCAGGVNVVDDYAHHPTELQVTIKAAREYYRPGKLYVVFQPHQHSRTRFLLNDFARSFSSADVVVVPDIFFVRDSAAERDLVDAKDLVGQIRDHGGEAYYEPDFDAIVAFLDERLRSGDLVITMGAGDVWRIADQLLGSLRRRG